MNCKGCGQAAINLTPGGDPICPDCADEYGEDCPARSDWDETPQAARDTEFERGLAIPDRSALGPHGDEEPPRPVPTPAQEVRASEIASRYGGGAIPHYAALAGLMEGSEVPPPSGWIVGNGSETDPLWRAWEDGSPRWTDQRDEATRYARREDAEAVHREDEDVWRVEPFEVEDLRPWGFAPGHYLGTCPDCPEGVQFVGDKRARRCREHAIAARDAEAIGNARSILEPFVSFADMAVDADGWKNTTGRERILDWFGPTDFRNLARLARSLGPIPLAMTPPVGARWVLGENVRKVRGSSWRGPIVGFYSTETTPIGYCVESAYEPGSVQLWPEAALDRWHGIMGDGE